MKDKIKFKIWDQVLRQVENQAWQQVRWQVDEKITGHVWNQVGRQIRDQVYFQLKRKKD